MRKKERDVSMKSKANNAPKCQRRNMKKASLSFGAAFAFLFAVAAGPTTQIADFTGVEPPAGWTVSNGEYRSPEYAGAVDRIELRYSGVVAVASATVQAFPASGEGVSIATFTAASSGASFDFPETTAFRSFRIASANGLALSSFTAYVAPNALDVPSGVSISNNVTGTSFDATWSAVEGATGYRVYVWTNAVTGASAGTTVLQETLPGATNAASTTKLTDAKFNACFENMGWTRSDKAGYPTGEDGTIRIGTSGDTGWIQTPVLHYAADGMAVRFQAKANASNTKSMDIAVERVSGETVTLAGIATLTTEMQEFTVALPDWRNGDSIRFNSITNGDRRTIIGTVVVIAGISAGHSEPVYIVDGLDVGAVTGYSFSGLPSVPVQFAVEAYGRRGVSSAKTEAVVVDLSDPDPVPVLNACPISTLMGHVYYQSFDQTAAVTSTSGDKDLLNGTTILYWQWFKNALAAGTFKWNAGLGTTGGIYALSTNQNEVVRSIGAYSTKNDEFSFGIAFTNDTGKAMKFVSLAYLSQQWGFKNTTNQTLSVSAKVVDNLDWISAYVDGWTELASKESDVYGAGEPHDTPVSTPVTVNPEGGVSIAPGQVLMLKWTIHSLKGGSPCMMGIDDVTVTFEVPQGLSIRIAGW
jgi:hypothetical protein